MIKILSIVLVSFVAFSSFGHEEEGGRPNIGPGKGVEAYDEHTGFKLSKEAIQRFGIETKELKFGNCDLKGVESIAALDRKEIFVLRAGKYKSIQPRCSEVKAGDMGVVKGAQFLRVIEMDLTSSEDEHHGEES